MWFRATAGEKPFVMTDRGLVLEFQPALPGWLFAEDGTLSFTFLGNVEVVYHNPSRVDLFPDGDVRVETINLVTTSGETVQLDTCRIAEPWASKVRAKKVVRIDVFLGGRCAKDERRDVDCLEIH